MKPDNETISEKYKLQIQQTRQVTAPIKGTSFSLIHLPDNFETSNIFSNTLIFFYKNNFYKNIKAQVSKY